MRSLIFSILILTIGNTGFAAVAKKTFDLRIKLSIEGKMVVVPYFSLPEKKIATFTKTVNKEKIFLTITATEQGQTEDHKSLILFVINVGKIDSLGNKIVLANPKMVTLENETAQVSQSNKLGVELLSLSVTANQKKD
jgi:hypothetical protein